MVRVYISRNRLMNRDATRDLTIHRVGLMCLTRVRRFRNISLPKRIFERFTIDFNTIIVF